MCGRNMQEMTLVFQRIGIHVEEEGKSAFAKGMCVGGWVRKENGEGISEKQRWYKRIRRQKKKREEARQEANWISCTLEKSWGGNVSGKGVGVGGWLRKDYREGMAGEKRRKMREKGGVDFAHVGEEGKKSVGEGCVREKCIGKEWAWNVSDFRKNWQKEKKKENRDRDEFDFAHTEDGEKGALRK